MSAKIGPERDELHMRSKHVLLMEDKMREDNFSRARNILLGAVDTDLALASPSQGSSAPDPHPGPSGLSSQQPHTRIQRIYSAAIRTWRAFSYKGKCPISQKKLKEGSADVEERLCLSA